MKRLFISALIVVVAAVVVGCAPHYPLNANLNLQVFSPGGEMYRGDVSASILGRDSRDNKEVLVYQLAEGAAVRITNLNPPHIVVTERLAGGLREQGLLFESSAPVRIVIDIKELIAKVSRPKLLYMTRAASSIDLNLESNGSTLTKNYRLTSERESLSKPDAEELETLLEKQLSDIVDQILKDQKVNAFIQNQ